MTRRIDKAGRVILPKPIRDRLGFRADSDLEMVETVDGVVLKRIEVRPSMIQIDGLWVHSGKTPPSFDIDRGYAMIAKIVFGSRSRRAFIQPKQASS